MRPFLILFAGLVVAGCNVTGQQATQSAVDAGNAPAATASAAPQEDMQSLPPIYNPLVDMNRKSPARFAKDHAECRLMAEPQERAARAAMAQQQSGAVVQAASGLVDLIPVSSFRQAVQVARAGNVVNNTGATMQAAGAQAGANATGDYALVVNNCLAHRGYVLLRG